MAVGDGGAAVAFYKYREGIYLVPVSDALTFDEYALVEPSLDRYGDFDSPWELALAWWRDSWWLFSIAESGVYLYEIRDHEIIGQWTLIEHPVGACIFEGATCPEVDTFAGFDVDSPYAYAWNDELWFGFRDNSQDPNTPTLHPYRVVRVLPGCSYLSINEIQARGIEIPTKSGIE